MIWETVFQARCPRCNALLIEGSMSDTPAVTIATYVCEPCDATITYERFTEIN